MGGLGRPSCAGWRLKSADPERCLLERLPLQDGRLCANYPRCCNKLLSDKSRSSSTPPDRPPPCPPPCTCNPEVHRRYCCGCLSIFPYPIIQLFERQFPWVI